MLLINSMVSNGLRLKRRVRRDIRIGVQLEIDQDVDTDAGLQDRRDDTRLRIPPPDDKRQDENGGQGKLRAS
jgi:hypothetical protein